MKHPSPSVLLLGGGYTLSALAEQLPTDTFVITTQSEEKQSTFSNRGWNAECTQIESHQSVTTLFQRWPTLTTIIDSIPPLSEHTDPCLGAKNILTAAANSCSRLIYLSTTGVYGKKDGSWVDESTPLTPYSEKSNARASVETTYRSELKERLLVLRLSGIYGPGRGLGVRLKRNGVPKTQYGDRYSNRIHRDDIVGVLQRSIQSDEAVPPVLNVSDDYPALTDEVIAYYQEKFALPFEQESREAYSPRFVLNQRVKNDLLKEHLSYSLRYPTYREGAGSEFQDKSTG
jgi:hypothetical protein